MEYLDFEQSADVGILKVNRPAALNALNSTMLEQLLHFLKVDLVKSNCKTLILTGAGEKAFIAGADIKEMQTMSTVQMLAFCELGQEVTLTLEQAPYLTIAAINGYALGGGLEIALACDVLYASHHAKFGFPEVSLGLIPGFGGTQRLSRAIGTHRAKELVMSGRTIGADDAKHLGLLNKVSEDSHLMHDCQSLAKEISRHPQTAVIQAKRAILDGYHMARKDALELERNMCAVCFSTPEREKGMADFLEKRNRS